MTRLSGDEIVDGIVKNGYDYDLQVWVKNYIIQDCGHPTNMKAENCCNAHIAAGKDIREYCIAVKDSE